MILHGKTIEEGRQILKKDLTVSLQIGYGKQNSGVVCVEEKIRPLATDFMCKRVSRES